MDRQMERSLFRNSPEAQQGTEATGETRSLAEDAGKLENQSQQTNANKGSQVTIEGMRAILIKQDYRCALSGVVLSPDCASLDHVLPLSKGGKHVLSNLQIVHPVVNGLKGKMSQDEFIEWVQLIASNIKDDAVGVW